MKRYPFLILTLLLTATLFTGCRRKPANQETVPTTIATMPTTIPETSVATSPTHMTTQATSAEPTERETMSIPTDGSSDPISPESYRRGILRN